MVEGSKLRTKTDYNCGTKSRKEFEYITREQSYFSSKTKSILYSSFKSDFNT